MKAVGAWKHLLGVGLGLLSQVAHAQMVTPGSFGVSESGAATYTIPIQVPPGTAGIEPKLALVYSSQSGNGLLGVGWSLSGLSAIGRCPRTMAQDGVRGGVNYDTNDRFCLDGQRLVVVSGSYGAAGSEYRTERESFSKITANGTANGAAANGPASFTVKTKAGLIMEYGATADSAIEAQGKTVVRTWALNKISDTKGNYLTISYTEDNPNGQFYPPRIDYTGNTAAGTTPANTVFFDYEARPDVMPMYQAGSLIKSTVRLGKVRMATGSEYRLAYQQSGGTGGSLATTITECISACRPSIEINWTPPGTTSMQWSVSNNVTPTWINDTNTQVITGDFNGDGRTDLLMKNPAYLSTPVYLSNGDGTWSISNNVTPTWINDTNTQVITGDFNGDGKTDLLMKNPTYQSTPVFLANIALGEQLSSVVTGTGSSTTVVYSFLPQLQGTRYQKELTPTFPQIAITPALQVVTDVDTGDGVGGTRRTSYSYGTAVAEVGTGRGFLGFNWVQSQDVATGLVSRSIYRQDFPYSGLVDQVWQGTGTSSAAELKNLGQSTNTYTCTDFVSASGCVVAAGKRYFVSSNQTDQKRWDLNGTALPITRTAQTFDPYGNATAVTVSTLNADGSASGYSKSTVSTYANDTTNWILGRLLKSAVTSTTP